MSEVSRILSAIESGDPSAADDLLPLVYEELRKLASDRLRRENPGQSLDATALVHDAYLRLVGVKGGQNWDGTAHFFASAAEAMRRILIDRARNKKRLKRGGNRARIDLSKVTVATDTSDETLLDLDDAIEALADVDQDAASIVKLKFFAGLGLKDAAETLGKSRRQGDRLWSFARAWLFDYLQKG